MDGYDRNEQEINSTENPEKHPEALCTGVFFVSVSYGGTVARTERLYPLIEWTPGETIVAPDGLFIAGAARGPRKENGQRIIQGRDTWREHYGGRLITDHHAAWIIAAEGRRPWRTFQLIWFEGRATYSAIKTHASIRHWLRSEAMTMWSYVDERMKDQGRGINPSEALVQIELALAFIPHTNAPSYGAPRRSDRH